MGTFDANDSCAENMQSWKEIIVQVNTKHQIQAHSLMLVTRSKKGQYFTFFCNEPRVRHHK